MKKNWFYLCALVCSVALFTACSDDESAKLAVDTVNGTYTSTDAEKQLQLTYGDVVMTGKSVTFNSADGQNATLTLTGAENTLLGAFAGGSAKNPGVIPGESTTTLNVTLVPQGETAYTFSGTDQSNDRTVNYAGSIEAGKLTLDVDVTFQNELIGTWNLAPIPEDSSDPIYPIYSMWESSKNIEISPGWEMPMNSVFGLAFRMPVIGEGDDAQSVCQMLATVLQSVTFGADGNVIATYSDAADVTSPAWQNSPAGMVQYCVKGDKIYAYLDIDAIMGAAMGASSKAEEGSTDLLTLLLPKLLSHIGEIAPMLSEGIPLNYDTTTNPGVLTVYIDQDGLGGVILEILKEIVNDPKAMAAITELAMSSMGPDSSFGSMLPAILEQLPAVLDGTTALQLGLNFNPASAE